MLNGAIVYITDINNEALDKISKHNLYKKQLFLEKVDASNAKEVENYFNNIKTKVNNIDALINKCWDSWSYR